MKQLRVQVIGGGLAGSEAAYQLAQRGFAVHLVEMRPQRMTAVHKGADFAELVCSNSLKSKKPDSAAGMLKQELERLGTLVYRCALRHEVAAGGALAVDREAFSREVTKAVTEHPLITVERREAVSLEEEARQADALVLATGPLTSDALSDSLVRFLGQDFLAFYDAAAPIVLAESLDLAKLFRMSRYETEAEGRGDYLNAPFTKGEYETFVAELVGADRVMRRDFETKDLFQACQPVEEIARKGTDSLRYGTLKPVGLVDPHTGKRPWAVLQLRAENRDATCYNLVGCQTNLTFDEQKRVFSLIPGLEHAEFCRYGVMHRNTFIDAPRVLDATGALKAGSPDVACPVFVAGQLAGTEGYAEAIRSGLHCAISVAALLRQTRPPALPPVTAFGALMAYATDPATVHYQPMHVNFGIMPTLDTRIRQKGLRYEAYAKRGEEALSGYVDALDEAGLLETAYSGNSRQ